MEPRICTYCGAEMETEGIRHRNRPFCSDECCESFEDEFLVHGEPDLAELEDEIDDRPFDLDDETFDLDSGSDLDDEF